MRLLSLLFLSFFLAKGCGGTSKKEMETALIMYQANTKGFYGKVIVQNQTVSVARLRGDGDMKTKKLSDSDWKSLVDEFKKVDLNTITGLEAPSQKRLHDGAATAKMEVNFKGTKYESMPFDHGNPPAEIKNLVNKIAGYLDEN